MIINFNCFSKSMGVLYCIVLYLYRAPQQGVDSGWAAGSRAPPIIQEEGHCPTNNLGGGHCPPKTKSGVVLKN